MMFTLFSLTASSPIDAATVCLKVTSSIHVTSLRVLDVVNLAGAWAVVGGKVGVLGRIGAIEGFSVGKNDGFTEGLILGTKVGFMDG